MEFATDYRSAMDREAEVGHVLNAGQLSIPTHPAKDQLEGLKTRIRMGAKNVELGFMGAGKGRQEQNTTPGLYGKDERAAMKELAKVNKVNLSVHGSISQYGFSGFTGQAFSEAQRKKHVDEIKRAVEFAGDTTEGGAVVMHMGEFPRAYWGIEKDGKLLQYPEEEEKAESYLVDKKTGKVIQGFNRDDKFTLPDIDKATGVMQTEMSKEGFLRPKTVTRTFEYYEKKAADNIKAGADPIKEYKKTSPAYMIQKAKMQEQLRGLKAEITRYTSQHEEVKEVLQNINMKIKLAETGNELAKRDLPDLKRQKLKYEHEVEFAKNYAASRVQGLEEAEQRLEHDIVPLENYGRQKSAESVAELAEYAQAQSKEKKTAKPIFVSPENVLLEWGYGGHPDELKNIIKDSRDEFIKRNKKKFGEEGAKKLAADHIKATFDVGHAYTWKKNFQGTDKEFNSWLMKKVDELNKAKIIGHVHMSDNFGFEDEHGVLGEGTAPIKEFVQKMNEAGFKGTMVAEPSHHDYKALLGAWRVLESPIYRVDNTSRTWSDMENSYVGRTFSPNYTFKTYLPIGGEKEQLNWGGVPME